MCLNFVINANDGDDDNDDDDDRCRRTAEGLLFATEYFAASYSVVLNSKRLFSPAEL